MKHFKFVSRSHSPSCDELDARCAFPLFRLSTRNLLLLVSGKKVKRRCTWRSDKPKARQLTPQLGHTSAIPLSLPGQWSLCDRLKTATITSLKRLYSALRIMENHGDPCLRMRNDRSGAWSSNAEIMAFWRASNKQSTRAIEGTSPSSCRQLASSVRSRTSRKLTR